MVAAGEAVAVGDLDLSRDNGGGTVPVQRAKFGDMPGLVSKIRDEFFVRSFEVLSRRLLGMVDAYAGDASGKPDWRVASHIGFYISGGSGIDGAMSLEMRSFFQRTGRERNDLEVTQRRGADGAKDDAEENFRGGSSSKADVGGGKYDGKGPGKSRARVSPYPAHKK